MSGCDSRQNARGRLRWLGHVLRRHKGCEISIGNVCRSRKRKRETEKEVVGCD